MDPSKRNDISAIVAARMAELPPVVRDAITSADLEKRLRALADSHKLHIDQWQKLENEVMLTLLGFQPIENLERNVRLEVGVSNEIAKALTADMTRIVFEPIRQELERQLEHPEAQEKEVNSVEAARNQALLGAVEETKVSTPTPRVQPATPPASAPDVKVTRPSDSTNYRPGETSAQRAAVHDDPYREAPL